MPNKTQNLYPAETAGGAAGDASAAPAHRAGMVAVVGRANVGKSTLVNTLLEEKISIVSPVPQTTRNLIRGVLTEPRGQLVFLDTPGVHKSRQRLGRAMNRVARQAVEGVDVVLLVVDASHPVAQEDEGWMARMTREEAACVIALNKCDVSDAYASHYRDCWARIAGEKEVAKSVRWQKLSTSDRTGIDELRDMLFTLAPAGPPLFPADVLTDFPRKLAIADVIREKLNTRLHEELPHAVAVLVESVDETETAWSVEAKILVQKPTQKGIVIGKKGRLLRAVKRLAEKELTAIYGKPVELNLRVRVQKHWDQDFWMLKRLGYLP